MGGGFTVGYGGIGRAVESNGEKMGTTYWTTVRKGNNDIKPF